MIKKGYEKVISMVKEVISSGNETPTRLATACSLGIFVAFSPFPGFHSLMLIAIRWLFGLNLGVLFLFASINNPWTMVPFYLLDYIFGYWFLHDLLGWSGGIMISLEKFYGPGSICLWSFIVGGNILGIVAGLISYPIAKRIFSLVYREKA